MCKDGKTIINGNGIIVTDEDGNETFKINSKGEVFIDGLPLSEGLAKYNKENK